jgi:hypothetical protein
LAPINNVNPAKFMNSIDDQLQYQRSRLIYQVLLFIQRRQDSLLADLVAYSLDPVRFKRRTRALIHLAEYQAQIITKISKFETDHPDELADKDLIYEICQEILSIVDINA